MSNPASLVEDLKSVYGLYNMFNICRVAELKHLCTELHVSKLGLKATLVDKLVRALWHISISIKKGSGYQQNSYILQFDSAIALTNRFVSERRYCGPPLAPYAQSILANILPQLTGYDLKRIQQMYDVQEVANSLGCQEPDRVAPIVANHQYPSSNGGNHNHPNSNPMGRPMAAQHSNSSACDRIMFGNASNTNSQVVQRQCDSCSKLQNIGLPNPMQRVSTFLCIECRSKNIEPMMVIQDIVLPAQFLGNKPMRFDVQANHYRLIAAGKASVHMYSYKRNYAPADGLILPHGTRVVINRVTMPDRDIVQKYPREHSFQNKAPSCDKIIKLPSRLLRSGPNEITITHRENDPFIMILCLTRTRPVSEVVAEIVAQSNTTLDEAQESVKKAFGSDDDDIVALSTVLGLHCPLSLMRIQAPARGKSCTHLQCFDLATYLQFNETATSKAWICTICHRYVPFSDLCVDPYFANILEQVKDEEDAEEVEVFPDASWKRKGEVNNDTKHRSSTKRDHAETIDIIDIDFSPTLSPVKAENGGIPMSSLLATTTTTRIVQPSSSSSSASNKPHVEMIDLSLSSDEEEVNSWERTLY